MRFRHAVLDDVFDADAIRAAAASWPAPGWQGWGVVYKSEHQRKRACNRWEDMPEPCRRLLGEMLFLDVSAFGLGPLVPDAGLWGGGMQDMGSGEWLSKHLDADTHKLSGLSRRLNAILFLSEWEGGWGGELDLYDASGSRSLVTIAPAHGRLVLFATGNDTWHAVRMVTAPQWARRKTLACWWYGPPTGERLRERAQFATAAPLPESSRKS